jgi:hypothetical protein
MHSTLPFALGTAALVAACATQPSQPARPTTQADVDAHVAKATAKGQQLVVAAFAAA